jgi:hypothetical protein
MVSQAFFDPKVIAVHYALFGQCVQSWAFVARR